MFYFLKNTNYHLKVNNVAEYFWIELVKNKGSIIIFLKVF